MRPKWSQFLAILPAGLAVYFVSLMVEVNATGPVRSSLPWAQSLGLDLTFHADGLGLLFAAIISGIGALITIFASKYFYGDARAGRFFATLFAFMGSMLGVVLSDNLYLLFVFWELTGFTSFLLIGFDHDKKTSRDSAIQAFIVTGTGGMALLAATVLVQLAAGHHNVSAMLAEPQVILQSAQYPWIVCLVLLAAFTKSAQWPFHFWLPNAMAAPTPVSAYLHSATMVKAGVFLIARMTPALGGSDLWLGLTVGIGAITMVLGAWRSIAETDLKRVLAYTTISALGVLTMLLGVGTELSITAALVYLCAHASYKGTLFLVAGTLEHETGTRDITQLGGLRESMPLVAAAGAMAAASMVGLPLFLGFVGKELFYEALFSNSAVWAMGLLGAAVLASALMGASGLIAGVRPFSGPRGAAMAKHAVPLALALPPLVLASFGLLSGAWPAMLNLPIGLAVKSLTPTAAPAHLGLWHGVSWVLGLSVLTLAAAAGMYLSRDAIRKAIWPKSLGSARLYLGTVHLLDALSAWSLPALQGASLRSYVRALVITSGLLTTIALIIYGLPMLPALTDFGIHELAAAMMIMLGAFLAARAKSTIQAVLALGITGYGVALTFLFFGAPDLAMTQFSVETLTAVIFVLVFYRFPSMGLRSAWRVRVSDAVIALVAGGAVSITLLFVSTGTTPLGLTEFFAESSLPLAHGRNIVNVILVDFRALDTLGEITVLATAAIGVRAVFRMGRRDGGSQ